MVHELFNDGRWRAMLLTDDTDTIGKIFHRPPTTPQQQLLEGCADGYWFIKSKDGYLGMIQLEELYHNKLVIVTGSITNTNTINPNGEVSRENIDFYRSRTFMGAKSKEESAKYAAQLKIKIEEEKFPPGAALEEMLNPDKPVSGSYL